MITEIIFKHDIKALNFYVVIFSCLLFVPYKIEITTIENNKTNERIKFSGIKLLEIKNYM